jgi:hypothetical protein
MATHDPIRKFAVAIRSISPVAGGMIIVWRERRKRQRVVAAADSGLR